MQSYKRGEIEKILLSLERSGALFDCCSFSVSEGGMVLLGEGGASYVYEMDGTDGKKYALKVSGFKDVRRSSKDFEYSANIQKGLSTKSPYVTGVLGAGELLVILDENLEVKEFHNTKEKKDKACEGAGGGIVLQFLLTEKLEPVIRRDRFMNAFLTFGRLSEEEEIIKFALDIGRALKSVHRGQVVHRDVKLENIYRDPETGDYKLGDFDMVKEYTGHGAETVVYTDGYVAPEIAGNFDKMYTRASDIYSFGITLYLLCNSLRFPYSDGYYVEKDLQYDRESSIPAPANAGEALVKIIRKMCSYSVSDRYQDMDSILSDLRRIGTEQDAPEAETEAGYRGKTQAWVDTEETGEKHDGDARGDTEKPVRRVTDKKGYLPYGVWHTALLSFLFVLLFVGTVKGYGADSPLSVIFFAAGLMAVGLFQRVRELNVIFGTAMLLLAAFSIRKTGFMPVQLLVIICVLAGEPELSFAAGIGLGAWVVLYVKGALTRFLFIWERDLGCIALMLIILGLGRLFSRKIRYGIESYEKYSGYFLMPVLLAFAGMVLGILNKFNVIMLPDFVRRMHPVITGLVTAVILFLAGPGEDDLVRTEEVASSEESGTDE